MRNLFGYTKRQAGIDTKYMDEAHRLTKRMAKCSIFFKYDKLK